MEVEHYEIIRYIEGVFLNYDSIKMLYKGDIIRRLTSDDKEYYPGNNLFKEIGYEKGIMTAFEMPLKKDGEPKFTKKWVEQLES